MVVDKDGRVFDGGNGSDLSFHERFVQCAARSAKQWDPKPKACQRNYGRHPVLFELFQPVALMTGDKMFKAGVSVSKASNSCDVVHSERSRREILLNMSVNSLSYSGNTRSSKAMTLCFRSAAECNVKWWGTARAGHRPV